MKLFVVGKITGCFGLKGYLKIQPATHSLERMKSLKAVLIGTTEQTARPLVVEDVIVRINAVLVKFEEVDSKTAAEQYRNCYLYVKEENVKKPPKGTYFIHEVIGCEVWDTDGNFVGRIEDVMKLPAQDVWSVRTKKSVFMVPAVKEFVQNIDLKNKKVVIRMMEGLAEEERDGMNDEI